MKTIRLSTNESDIRQAGGIIRGGGLVAFPTETVYGLGANALDEEAVRSIYAAKGRPSDNPMIVHISSVPALDDLIEGGTEALSADARRLIDELWPGPLTMVFHKSGAVPYVTTGGLDTVAVRMPSNATARSLITSAYRPIAAPSANISGRPSPTTAEDVLEDMDGRIDAVIMGEQCAVGIESTVVDMTGDVPVILRPGILSREYLSDVLGRQVIYDRALLERPGVIEDPAESAATAVTTGAGKAPADHASADTTGVGKGSADSADSDTAGAAKATAYSADSDTTGADKASANPASAEKKEERAGNGETELRPRSPGMKYKHYAPRANVVIIEGDDERFRERAKALGLEAMEQGKRAAVIDYGGDADKAAHKFFADLRELDRQGYDLILVRSLEQQGKGFSVMNRMLKSAGYDLI